MYVMHVMYVMYAIFGGLSGLPALMHAYMSMQICIYAYMHACMHARIYASIYACIYACMYACMYACTHACAHTHIYIYIYIYIQTILRLALPAIRNAIHFLGDLARPLPTLQVVKMPTPKVAKLLKRSCKHCPGWRDRKVRSVLVASTESTIQRVVPTGPDGWSQQRVPRGPTKLATSTDCTFRECPQSYFWDNT